MIGIYKIENLINHKVYIGQSVDMKNRLNHHRQMLDKGIHFCAHLQHSWNKHGKDNFSFCVLEECAKEDLDEKENFWLEKYGGHQSVQTFNQRSGGQESHDVPEEVREKLRQANLGKKQSPETIAKRVEKLKGRSHKGRKWTEEEKKRASERQKGKINDALKNLDRNDPFYRKRLSEALKGKKKSKEHARHISEGRKGIIFTEEHRKNMSKSRIGIITTPKGSKRFKKDGIVKTAKPEEIEKFKREGWEEYHEFYAGKNYVRGEPWNKGKCLSEATKQRLREINLGKRYSKETNMKKGLNGKGKIWIYKDKINKRVSKENLNDFIQNGWAKGKTRK